MATSLAELAGLGPTDTDALVRAADTLFERGDFSLAARVYGALEALDGRRAFTYRRALAEAKGGQTAAALVTLGRLLGREIGPSPTTVEALKLRASLLQSTDPQTARADLELAARFAPGATVSWN